MCHHFLILWVKHYLLALFIQPDAVRYLSAHRHALLTLFKMLSSQLVAVEDALLRLL